MFFFLEIALKSKFLFWHCELFSFCVCLDMLLIPVTAALSTILASSHLTTQHLTVDIVPDMLSWLRSKCKEWPDQKQHIHEKVLTNLADGLRLAILSQDKRWAYSIPSWKLPPIIFSSFLKEEPKNHSWYILMCCLSFKRDHMLKAKWCLSSFLSNDFVVSSLSIIGKHDVKFKNR